MSELVKSYSEAESRLSQMVERFRSHPLAATETYTFFEVDDSESVAFRNQQKNAFLSGQIHNPELNFPQLDRPDVLESIIDGEKDMLNLMAESTDLAHDWDREVVLYDLLRIKRLEFGMLLLSHDNLSSLQTDDQKQAGIEYYNRLNDEINGPLEPARFNGLLQKQRDLAQQILADDKATATAKAAARYYLENTNQPADGAESIAPIEVDQLRFKKLQDYLQSRYADLLGLVPDKPEGEKYTAEEVAEIFRKAHELRNTGWSVRLQPGKATIDTRQNEKATVIGADKQRTADNTRGILVHENGVHVQRRINGDNLGDPLLGGLGLPWYLPAEEGLTTIFQQAIEGEVSDAGEQYYLAIGLTRGLDGQVRDFRDVYELDLGRRIMMSYVDGKQTAETEEGLDKLKSQAYSTALRVRRGTRAEVPGVAYTKDTAYYLGNQKMWEILLAMAELPEKERDEQFDALMAAKYDPTNPVHLKVVKKSINYE